MGFKLCYVEHNQRVATPPDRAVFAIVACVLLFASLVASVIRALRTPLPSW